MATFSAIYTLSWDKYRPRGPSHNVTKVAKNSDMCNCVCVLEHFTEKGPCKICNSSAFVRGLYKFFFHTSKENIFNFSITRN